MNIYKCCKCGKDCTHSSCWNGVTNRTYCNKCAAQYFFEGDTSEDGVFQLHLEDFDLEDSE